MVGDSADDDAAWPINIDKFTAAQSNVERLCEFALYSLREFLCRIRPEWLGPHCVQDSAHANAYHDEQDNYHKWQP